jgi:glycosyltransferase involved in cell wall biosynthesis
MTQARTETQPPTTSREKLVIFAPYPPARSGISDYVAELMPYHVAEFDVTLVIADDAPIPNEVGARVLLASEFRKHRAFFEEAVKLYHIGNNPHHCYMLDFLGSDPGIVVLHDYNLCYLHEMATLRWGLAERHRDDMEREYGALGGDILDWQTKYGHRELFAGYELPLNGDVLERAVAVIAHSQHVQYKVAARIPRTPVWHISHHLSPRTSEFTRLSKQSARTELGLPIAELIVTAIGFVTRAKQIPMTLDALSSLRGQVPRFRFILAGERRPEEYDVDADIAKSGLSDLVTCTDYLDEDLFFKHLVAADVVVNLRYPSAGEMSGTLIRSLGLGVPTIVLDHGPMGELPGSVVRKVSWDDNTLAALTEALRELLAQEPTRSGLSARATRYARETHDIDRVAGQYSRVVHEVALGNSPKPAEPLRFCYPHIATVARKMAAKSRDRVVRRPAGSMWWTVPAVPMAFGDELSALVVSADVQGTAGQLSELFGWSPTMIRAMSLEEFLGNSVRGADGTPLAAKSFAFALAIVPANLDEAQAAALLKRLNVALRNDGHITLETSTPLDLDECQPPLLGQEQLPLRLRDAGFGDVRAWSPQEGLISELVGDGDAVSETLRTCCVSGRKMSDYTVWRYAVNAEGLPLRTGGRLGIRANDGV